MSEMSEFEQKLIEGIAMLTLEVRNMKESNLKLLAFFEAKQPHLEYRGEQSECEVVIKESLSTPKSYNPSLPADSTPRTRVEEEGVKALKS